MFTRRAHVTISLCSQTKFMHSTVYDGIFACCCCFSTWQHCIVPLCAGERVSNKSTSALKCGDGVATKRKMERTMLRQLRGRARGSPSNWCCTEWCNSTRNYYCMPNINRCTMLCTQTHDAGSVRHTFRKWLYAHIYRFFPFMSRALLRCILTRNQFVYSYIIIAIYVRCAKSTINIR